MKLELFTGVTVVDDAMRFVEERTKLISGSEDNLESKKPESPYDHHNEESELRQENDTVEIQ
jgi:hypothetical protein